MAADLVSLRMRSLARLVRRSARATLAAAALALVAACDGSTDPDSDAHVTAAIDGSGWRANYQVNQAVGDISPAGDRVEIVGLEITGVAGRQITIGIGNFAGVGTYAIGTTASGRWALYLQSPDVFADPEVRAEQDVLYFSSRADAGTIAVTSWDAATGRIAGTFSFEATVGGQAQSTAVRVTNGSFAGRLAPAE